MAASLMAVLAVMTAAPAVLTAQQPGGEADRGRSVGSTVLHLVGGAVVGGWLGWMGSQVAMSDWDRSSNDELLDRRAGWVIGGAITGMIASQFIGSTSTPGAVPGLAPTAAPNRGVITRSEIESSGVTNAYELIQSLRGEWLRAERGTNQWSESARGTVSETEADVTLGDARIMVYLNSTRLGGLETLREISLYELQRAEFIGPAQATMRYGTGHTHGVIQLWTVESRSAGSGSEAGRTMNAGPVRHRHF